MSYVSTGHLPAPGEVRALVDEAYERYRSVAEGKVSDVYPALARVPGEQQYERRSWQGHRPDYVLLRLAHVWTVKDGRAIRWEAVAHVDDAVGERPPAG